MKQQTTAPIDIGIPEKNRKEIAEGLCLLLADTYTLYLKTHRFHWNVVGPLFQMLHSMFDQQYNELWAAIDVIAERIRALGVFVPGTYAELSELSSIKEEKGEIKAKKMIQLLVDGHETVIQTARKVFPLAEKGGDQVTMDFLTQRMEIHEKTAWMLRSSLED